MMQSINLVQCYTNTIVHSSQIVHDAFVNYKPILNDDDKCLKKINEMFRNIFLNSIEAMVHTLK